MRIAFSSDDLGRSLIVPLMGWATQEGHDVSDLYTPHCPYTEAVHITCCNRNLRGTIPADSPKAWDRLVLACGSGIGVMMTANRYPGVRCCWALEPEHASLARMYNDANAIAFGANMILPYKAIDCLRVFLVTPVLSEGWGSAAKGIDIPRVVWEDLQTS